MSARTVKLGIMPPLTGLVAIYGTEIVHAATIACEEVNDAGGVLGMPLELVIEDDGSLPESAVTAASRLVDAGCAAIIGNLLSNSRISVAYRVAEPHGVPYLNFSFYEGSISSRYFFNFAALPNQQIEKMIPYMLARFGPKMYFAGNNYEWPRGSVYAAKQALEKAGGAVLGEEYTPIGVDLSTIDELLDHVQACGPDVFVPYFAGEDQVKLLTRFTERGLKNHCHVVMGHYDEMMASKLSAHVREGFYSSNTYFMEISTDANRRYLEKLANLPDVDGIWPHGNGILTNFGEGTYICVKAFAQAANTASSLHAEDLVRSLENVCVSAPQGMVRMDAALHHAEVNTYLAKCCADGRFTIIENFGSILPVLPEHYTHQRIKRQATIEDDIRLQARILEQMTEAVLLVKLEDNSILYCNNGADVLFGYPHGKLTAMTIDALDDRSRGDPYATASDIIPILKNKGKWNGEIRISKNDGTVFWCSACITTFTHPVSGEVWLWVLADISRRTSVERDMRIKDAAIDSAINGIAISGADERIFYVNRAFIEMWHLPAEDSALGRSPLDFLLLPDQAVQLRDTINEQGFWQGEITAKRHDNSIGNFQLSANRVLDPAGNPSHLMTSFIDITDRKKAEIALRESEARYRRAEHGTNDGLWEWNIITGYDYFSPRWLRMLGYNPGELPYHVDTFADLLHPEDKERTWATVQSHLQSGSVFDSEFRLRHKNGEYIWVRSRAQAEFDTDNKPMRMTGSITDITESKRAQLELSLYRDHLEELVQERTAEMQLARDEAEAANAAKSEFLSRMSHEFRTPLNVILGFSQLMEQDHDEPLTDSQRDNIHEILHAGKRLLALVNEVLDFSKIVGGELNSSPQLVALAPMIRLCLQQCAGMMEKKHIHTDLHLDETATVMSDPLRMKQILMNLLSNAIKYNKPGGSIQIHCQRPDSWFVKVTIEDTGIGISADFLPKLFKPFERQNSAFDGIEGTGIGLSLTKKLLESMGGEVGVRSTPDQGSIFWFLLPAADDEKEPLQNTPLGAGET